MTQSAHPSNNDAEQPNGDGGNHMSSTSKPAAPKKKKGTAAAVKAPTKRARPGAAGGGGGRKSKAGGPKKAKTDASTKQPGGGAANDADHGGNTSESDNGPYCLCRGPDDHRFMISCDRCEDWFHGECVGMDKHTGENLVQKYICPNCTDGGRYTTRYKKMCSLSGCQNPARIYDSVRPSIFCSSEHCQAWWEQLIGTLPRTKGDTAADGDHLTQSEFMGLLDAQNPLEQSPHDSKDLAASPWKLGKRPFETPPDFWDHPSSIAALTPEEQQSLTQSAADRYQLGEEIVLCKKMLQLIDMALSRREAAIAAGRGTAKDFCGYDFRLDTVGTTHQFALFLASPEGEAIFKSGRLDPPPPPPPPSEETTTTNGSNPPENTNNNNNTTTTNNDPAAPVGPGTAPAPGRPEDPLTAGMCARKKCKAHNGWSGILTKAVRHDMKELAAQAKEKLDGERRVRDGAAGRFRRRIKERNGVVVLYGAGSPGAGVGSVGGGEGGNGGVRKVEMEVDG
ncbi:hypothetical protein VTK26DRAFT_1467 [Humicola hyalothermophila]